MFVNFCSFCHGIVPENVLFEKKAMYVYNEKMGFELRQSQMQKQVQVMSQKQIASLNILSLGTHDLVDVIKKEVEENPTLVFCRQKSSYYAEEKYGSSYGESASDNYLSILESKADERTNLQEHLISQLNMMNLLDSEKTVCEKLVYNLDQKGFHILSPISLLDKKDKCQTPGLLEKCIGIVQQLDPPGICVKNMEESLMVQAMQKTDANRLALFILDGKFDYLKPPVPEKILQKIRDYVSDRKKMFGDTEKNSWILNLKLSIEDVDEMLAFLRTLDPFPARNFSSSQTHYVEPNIYVLRLNKDDVVDMDDVVIEKNGSRWKVESKEKSVPQLMINPELKNILKSKSVSDEEKKKMAENIKRAQEFIDTVEYRQNTVTRACLEIVRRQLDFFDMGPGNLKPLVQQDIADVVGVHESTISRMASSKYIQCEWGLFDVKYFFTNAASAREDGVSRDKVLHQIKAIVDGSSSSKKLSDEKIRLELEKMGSFISRRTVAKYRHLLNIDSSYDRV